MKKIRLHFIDYEFEENDPDFDCLKQLVEMEEKGELAEIDVAVISSMFELHKELPSLPKALFNNGFTLPENKKSLGDRDSIWKYEKDGEDTRILKYKQKMWDTMWMRSDHYHIDIEYKVGDLVALYEYRDCEDDYGRSKKRYKYCCIKKNDKIILEHKKDFLK